MATLKEEIEAIKNLQDGIVKNKVANFAYTDEAYTKNEAGGVEIYDVNQSQNIPVPDPDVLRVNPTVLTKGYRAQASSVTRMLMNHFFGRTSYNLNKVNDFFLSLLTKLSAYLGKANGIATLDGNARVPVEQLQNVTGTKGKANGIATLDGNARVPVEQLQNIINDASASGNKTYSSNKIDTMNTNLNNKIDLLNLKQIYANYIIIEFYNPARKVCLVFCNLITPFKISNFDDFYDYLSQNRLSISASGKYPITGTDTEFASIYTFSCGNLTNRTLNVQYINKNGIEGLFTTPVSYLKNFSSVSKELL